MGSLVIGDCDTELVDSIEALEPAVAVAVYPCVGRGAPKPPLHVLHLPTTILHHDSTCKSSSTGSRSVCSQDSGSEAAVRRRGRGRAQQLQHFAKKVPSQPGGLDLYDKTKSARLANIETQSDGPVTSKSSFLRRGPQKYDPWRHPQAQLFNMEQDFPRLGASVDSVTSSGGGGRKSQSVKGSSSAQEGQTKAGQLDKELVVLSGNSELSFRGKSQESMEAFDELQDRLDEVRDERLTPVLDGLQDELDVVNEVRGHSDVVSDSKDGIQDKPTVCEALDDLRDQSHDVEDSGRETSPKTSSLLFPSEPSKTRPMIPDCELSDSIQPLSPADENTVTSPQSHKSSNSVRRKTNTPTSHPCSHVPQNTDVDVCDLGYLIQVCQEGSQSDDDDSEESEIVDPVIVIIDNLPADVDWESFVTMLSSYGRLVSLTKSLQTNGTSRVSVQLCRDSAEMMVSCLEGSDVLFEGFVLTVYLKELSGC